MISYELKQRILDVFIPVLFLFFRILPLQNKIVATTMRGMNYADNPRYILEKFHELYPQISCVWIRNGESNYFVPNWIKLVNRNNIIRYVYEYATAKVWIDSHHLRSHLRKRNGQICIQTWHGGLGIKKIEGDLELDERRLKELEITCRFADVFISNSLHLTNIYKTAFGYKGPILRCGYPKNEIEISTPVEFFEEFKKRLGIVGKKILLYAPTFRDGFNQDESIFETVYNLDFELLHQGLCSATGQDWVILNKWHPIMENIAQKHSKNYSFVIDVTHSGDMQQMLKVSDILVSDYSSCIFDAAEQGVPCFTYTPDFESYKKNRGVYYEMTELPFPNSNSTENLINSILNFNKSNYLAEWNLFKKRVGLVNNGNSAEIISKKIMDFLTNGRVSWMD